MQLVIISGPEATGKSEIGRRIAAHTGYQYVSKDQIKEALFDKAPRSTWNYGWYEQEAKKRFFHELRDCIAHGTNVIIESNFIGTDRGRLKACLDETVHIAEIYCTARGMASFRRFVARNEHGRRHTGHHDRRWYAIVFFQNCLRYFGIEWPYKRLGIGDRFIQIDTTDFSKVHFQEIWAFVRPY